MDGMATSVLVSSHQSTQHWAILKGSRGCYVPTYSLWATTAKGYHEGFVPYVSGKYSKEAFDEGKKTWDGWSGRDVGLVTDQKVLENVFKGEYDSWIAFKKAMYKERLISWQSLSRSLLSTNFRNPNSTKKVTIRSYAQMQKLMDEAVAEDVGNITNATSRVEASWVNLLKKKIYNAYLRETDDFRQSIFKK